MDELTKAFYDVMYKYQKFFSAQGIAANLNAWEKNKGALVDLLRRHLSWNEQEKAIVFDLSVSREIDRDIVDECKFALRELVDESGLSDQQCLDFDVALAAATAEYSKFPSEDNIEVIKARGGIKCAAGQKTSRILGRLCNQFGISSCSICATTRNLPSLSVASGLKRLFLYVRYWRVRYRRAPQAGSV